MSVQNWRIISKGGTYRLTQHHVNPEKRWLSVLGDTMPLCLSYAPIGLACGILLHAAGFNFIMAFLVSILVYSGGAQFILASMLVINAPLSTIFMTIFFLEMRYALLGSSLSKYLHEDKPWDVFLFAFSLNDENYAINYLKYATDKNWTIKDATMVEHFALISWTGGNLIGALVGSTISIDLDIIEFALTALFIYMLVMQVRNHLTLLICLLAGALSVLFLVLIQNTLGLIISTLMASLIGFAVENYVRKHSKHPKRTWILGEIFRPSTIRQTVEDKRKKQDQSQEAANH